MRDRRRTPPAVYVTRRCARAGCAALALGVAITLWGPWVPIAEAVSCGSAGSGDVCVDRVQAGGGCGGSAITQIPQNLSGYTVGRIDRVPFALNCPSCTCPGCFMVDSACCGDGSCSVAENTQSCFQDCCVPEGGTAINPGEQCCMARCDDGSGRCYSSCTPSGCTKTTILGCCNNSNSPGNPCP